MPLIVTQPPPVRNALEQSSDDFRDYVSSVNESIKGYLPQTTSEYLWSLSIPLICVLLIFSILIFVVVRRLEKRRFHEQQLKLAYDPHPASPPIVMTIPDRQPAGHTPMSLRGTPAGAQQSPLRSANVAAAFSGSHSPFGNDPGLSSPHPPASLRGSSNTPR